MTVQEAAVGRLSGLCMLLWVAVAMALLWALAVGGGPAGVVYSSLRAGSLLIALIAFLAWAIAARRNPEWRPRSALLPGFAACLLALAVSTAFSRSPLISLQYLAYAAVLTGLYLLVVRLVALSWLADRMAALAGMFGILLAAAYIGISIQSWVEYWAILGRLAPPPVRPESLGLIYGNPSPAMTMIVLLAATAIGRVVGGSGAPQWRFVLAGGIGTVAFTAALFSGTRSGILALIAAFAVVAVVAAGRGRDRFDQLWHAAMERRRSTLLFVVPLIVLVLAAVLVGPQILGRFAAGADPDRIEFYTVATRMFADAPVTGIGPGMWAIDRIRYTATGEPDFYVQHAHDLYLQTAAEVGLIGLAAGIITVGLLARLVWNALSDSDSSTRRWAWVAVFAIAFFACQEVLDFLLDIPATLVALAIPIAMVDARSGRREGSALWRFRPLRGTASRLPAVGLIGVIAAIGFGVSVEVGAAQHEQAVGLGNSGRWSEAQPLAQGVADRQPWIGVYDLTAGLAAAHLGNFAMAEADFANVTAQTDLPVAWLDLADAQVRLGEQDAARASLASGMRLGIQQRPEAMAAAGLALTLGEHDMAVRAATAAIAITPSLAADPWWQATADRRKVLDESVDAILADAEYGQTQWQVVLMGRGPAAALAYLTSPAVVALGTADRALASDVVGAWGGDSAAAQRLYDRCTGSETSTLGWCARVSRHVGDPRADEYRRLAQITGSRVGALGEYAIAEPGAARFPPVSSGDAVLYGLLAYWRASPDDPLSPGLVHLTLR